ncbi:MAG: 2-hydroxycyclohexane-1-carbonyl-CoA dehydrogenase [Phycisphaerae bacterium]
MKGLLEGRCAVVTGASSGIGQGIARVLAREGANLVVTCRANRAGLDEILEAIQALGRSAVPVELELSSLPAIRELISTAVARFGRLDILVNNAGVDTTAPFLETTPELFDHLFAVDARGTFFCAQEAARVMVRQGGGKIINVSTLHTRASTHHFCAYAAAKAAVDKMTEVMAIELAAHGVQVNAIAPGWIPTRREPIPPGMAAECLRYVPRGVFGTPEDVGELAAFLASDRADHVTGQTLYVDGGQSLVLSFPSPELERDFHRRLRQGSRDRRREDRP